MIRFSSSSSTRLGTTNLPSPTAHHRPLCKERMKRRRGRQPRPSMLSSTVKAAVRDFASQVGQPRVIEPAGFRDFRGWLAFINSSTVLPLWAPIINAIRRESGGDHTIIDTLKGDVVREIVKIVVVPRIGESSKLVSTNCGRQCARPTNGVTLMTILDRLLLPPELQNNHSSNPSSMSSPFHHHKFMLHHHHYIQQQQQLQLQKEHDQHQQHQYHHSSNEHYRNVEDHHQHQFQYGSQTRYSEDQQQVESHRKRHEHHEQIRKYEHDQYSSPHGAIQNNHNNNSTVNITDDTDHNNTNNNQVISKREVKEKMIQSSSRYSHRALSVMSDGILYNNSLRDLTHRRIESTNGSDIGSDVNSRSVGTTVACTPSDEGGSQHSTVDPIPSSSLDSLLNTSDQMHHQPQTYNIQHQQQQQQQQQQHIRDTAQMTMVERSNHRSRSTSTQVDGSCTASAPSLPSFRELENSLLPTSPKTYQHQLRLSSV